MTGQCPGPSQFKCCSSTATGFGGYSAPSIPAVGACKSVAVNGAKAIVAAWPGRVREIGCVRSCACPGDSDHCCGKATDMMCSDGGGVSSLFTYPYPHFSDPTSSEREKNMLMRWRVCVWCRFPQSLADRLQSG